MLAIKKYIISSNLGRIADSGVRLLLSFIPWLVSVVSKSDKDYEPDCFVFFLYGGIGDVVLQLQLINKLAGHVKVVIFCDKTISGLSFLFSGNVEIVLYDKSAFFKNRNNYLFSLKDKQPVFVQTSPIFEMFVLRKILKIPYAIGLLASFLTIRNIGLNDRVKNIDSTSRLDVFECIYNEIVSTWGWSPVEDNIRPVLRDNIDIHKTDFKIKKPYVIISTTKSAQWDMGKMPNEEYVKLADFIVSELGLTAVFVGHETEFEAIKDLTSISSSPKKSIINLAGKTNLFDLTAILQYAEFVVSNDNGVSHLSSYLGVKTLVLFMFSDPEVYRWGGDDYAAIFNKIENCMPCIGFNKLPKDNYPVICPNNLACNNSITYKDIAYKLRQLGWVAESHISHRQIKL